MDTAPVISGQPVKAWYVKTDQYHADIYYNALDFETLIVKWDRRIWHHLVLCVLIHRCPNLKGGLAKNPEVFELSSIIGSV